MHAKIASFGYLRSMIIDVYGLTSRIVAYSHLSRSLHDRPPLPRPPAPHLRPARSGASAATGGRPAARQGVRHASPGRGSQEPRSPPRTGRHPRPGGRQPAGSLLSAPLHECNPQDPQTAYGLAFAAWPAKRLQADACPVGAADAARLSFWQKSD
jgi:hypothetical protein